MTLLSHKLIVVHKSLHTMSGIKHLPFPLGDAEPLLLFLLSTEAAEAEFLDLESRLASWLVTRPGEKADTWLELA